MRHTELAMDQYTTALPQYYAVVAGYKMLQPQVKAAAGFLQLPAIHRTAQHIVHLYAGRPVLRIVPVAKLRMPARRVWR